LEGEWGRRKKAVPFFFKNDESGALSATVWLREGNTSEQTASGTLRSRSQPRGLRYNSRALPPKSRAPILCLRLPQHNARGRSFRPQAAIHLGLPRAHSSKFAAGSEVSTARVCGAHWRASTTRRMIARHSPACCRASVPGSIIFGQYSFQNKLALL
jgi:hypothetical protein